MARRFPLHTAPAALDPTGAGDGRHSISRRRCEQMGYKATGSGSAQASNRTRLGWALPFALGMSSAAATDWRELLQHADELNARGQHQKAADHYATILDQPQPQLSPHMAERIRLRLANSQMAAGNFASARASLQPLMRQSGANLAEARALGFGGTPKQLEWPGG